MLDKNYYSMYQFKLDFEEECRKVGSQKFEIALRRGKEEVAVKTLKILPSNRVSENTRFVERVVKTMIWAYGGYHLYLKGDDAVIDEIQKIYSKTGERKFDVDFMSDVYQTPFVVEKVSGKMPKESRKAKMVGGNTKGRRIGFDAGGSDRKVTACIDGKVIFEKEVVWQPKLNDDPTYHKAGILDSINMGLKALDGKVDAIGVSSAGIVIDDELRVSSLFIKVPKSKLKSHVFRIYKDLEEHYGVPVNVSNDGDIAALAGAEFLNSGKVLGLALGTSEAAGYIDKDMHIVGYLNELAFVPVDANRFAIKDEWSGDIGVGCKYHSQDAVIKLAPEAKIEIDKNLILSEKLIVVQDLANKKDKRALSIFEKLGEYLAYSIMWYKEFYDIEHVVLYGRVVSGTGGDTLIAKAQKLLDSLNSGVKLVLPDEMVRRLGQSYTASTL
ncbi:MAG TPA: ROK family protein [Clostridiales bacterium]|nr:ROK family protein [Clostridiales bacterium]